MMAFSQAFTHDIPRRIWSAYFDGLSQMYQGWRCNVEVVSMEVGDQPLIDNARLWGLSFERKGSAANSILIETGDPSDGIAEHWALDPITVREINSLPGHEADIQVECSDGSMIIIRIQRRPELPAGTQPASGRNQRRWQSRSGDRSLPPFDRSTEPSSRFASQRARNPDTSRWPRRAQLRTEPSKGSVLIAIAAGAAGLWLLSRMLAGRRTTS